MSRRFIAGAVCPKCEKMDKIFVEGEGSVAKCAACGYELQQPGEAEASPIEEVANDQAVTLVNFKTNNNGTNKE